MQRVVIVGQRGTRGPLSCERFAELLGLRLGLRAETVEQPALPAGLRYAYTPGANQIPMSLMRANALDAADTIVWLHFSPLPYLRDWLAGGLERLNARLYARLNAQLSVSDKRNASKPDAQAPSGRARWLDVLESLTRLTLPPELDLRAMRRERPAVNVVELRTPSEALFWLRMQEAKDAAAC